MATVRLTIEIEVPEGAEVRVTHVEESGEARDSLLEFWQYYLRPNAQRFYRAAAVFEEAEGPGFTLEDVASAMSVTYESAKSYHRNAGRSARRWREEKGEEAPIRLISTDYGPRGTESKWRTKYRLPEGVAGRVADM